MPHFADERMIVMMLGNLSISQIERRLGIELTEENREFLNKTHQEEANRIISGKWHCFDIPFFFACGGSAFAKEIIDIFSPYSNKVKIPMQIGVEGK